MIVRGVSRIRTYTLRVVTPGLYQTDRLLTRGSPSPLLSPIRIKL